MRRLVVAMLLFLSAFAGRNLYAKEKGTIDDWTSSLKFTYTHPIGIFAGVGSNSLIDWTLYVGKQFEF